MRKVLLVLVLSGCASANQTYLADGGAGYTLDCSGSARSWNMCLEKAGDLCGTRGYNVLWTNQEQQGAFATATQYGSLATTTHPRNMVVRCR